MRECVCVGEVVVESKGQVVSPREGETCSWVVCLVGWQGLMRIVMRYVTDAIDVHELHEHGRHNQLQDLEMIY